MGLDYNIIGSRIKKARMAKNLTQEDLAEKIVMENLSVRQVENLSVEEIYEKKKPIHHFVVGKAAPAHADILSDTPHTLLP